MCGALERAATSISGPRAARALAGGAERLESTSVWILFHISPVIGGSCGRELGRQACALPSGAQQCKLDLTSCDRRGRDALAGCGGAVRGCQGVHPGRLGEPNARDMPCPKPAAFPAAQYSQLDLAGCERRAIRRVGSAVRPCWAIVFGRGPPPKAYKSGHRVPCTAPPPMAQVSRACWGRRATGATLSRLRSAPHRDGAAASPTGALAARRWRRPEPPRARASCW